jgi:hypothetical protein
MAAALKPGGWLVVEDFDSRQGVNSVCPERTWTLPKSR